MNFQIRPAYGVTNTVIAYRSRGRLGLVSLLLSSQQDSKSPVTVQLYGRGPGATDTDVAIGSAVTIVPGGQKTIDFVSNQANITLKTSSGNTGTAVLRIEPKGSCIAYIDVLDENEQYMTGYGIGDAAGYAGGGDPINTSL